VNPIDAYVNDVLHDIQAPPHERARIEADLRAHLQEALDNLGPGESIEMVMERMGSPKEIAGEFMAGVRLHYAGFWRRLAAFAIDAALCLAVALPLIVVIVVLSNRVPERDPQGTQVIVGGVLIMLIISLLLAIIGLFLLYFPILEGRFAQTPGKHLLGLRVVKESGAPIGFREAFLRRLSFYFDFLPVDALFIPFTEKKQRAFDILAETVVIQEPK